MVYAARVAETFFREKKTRDEERSVITLECEQPRNILNNDFSELA